MKLHIKPKNGQYWVFSSKQASTHAMPQHKVNTLYFAMRIAKDMK